MNGKTNASDAGRKDRTHGPGDDGFIGHTPGSAADAAGTGGVQGDGSSASIERILEVLKSVAGQCVPRGAGHMPSPDIAADICDAVPDAMQDTVLVNAYRHEMPLIQIYSGLGRDFKSRMLSDRTARKALMTAILVSQIRDNLLAESACQTILFSTRNESLAKQMAEGGGTFRTALDLKHSCEHSVRAAIALLMELDRASAANSAGENRPKSGAAAGKRSRKPVRDGICAADGGNMREEGELKSNM